MERGELGKRWMGFAFATAVVAVLVWIFIASLPIPFESKKWQASPPERWVSGSARYKMRKGALAAVKRSRTLQEVESLLGPPDTKLELPKDPDLTVPIVTYEYSLGATRRFLEFWEIQDNWQIVVDFDGRGQLVSAGIYRSRS